MSNHSNRRVIKHSPQSGAAIIIILFVLTLAASAVVYSRMSPIEAKVANNRHTVDALTGAKAALIGQVLSDKTTPGQFYCAENPALIGTSNEGQALSSCSNTNMSTGRFAWLTVGSGDLKDANDERLWYALSPRYRTAPINSDSINHADAGLTVNGVSKRAIALIFSPGPELSGQSRPIPVAPSGPSIGNYLDGENSNGDKTFITGQSSSTFNDNLIEVRPDDVFPLIEKRVLGEIRNYLITYKANWKAFPYPANFSNPSTADYKGNTLNSGGLLPLTEPDVEASWQSGTWITLNPINFGSCTLASANQRLYCDVTISGTPGTNQSVFIFTQLNRVGLSFYKVLDNTNSSDLRFTALSGTPVMNSSTLNHTLDSSGGGAIVLVGMASGTGTMRVDFRRPPQHDNWAISTLIPNYITANNWHELIYYKVASTFLPGGSGTCGSLCLSVNQIDSNPTTTQTGIHALLMIAGRRLDATNVRPSPTYHSTNPAQSRYGNTLTDYFDSTNNISAGLIFDHSTRPLTTFNDQIEIVE